MTCSIVIVSFFDISQAEIAFKKLQEQPTQLQVAYLYGNLGQRSQLTAICESSESNKSDKSEENSDSEKKSLPAGPTPPEEAKASAALEQKAVELRHEYEDKSDDSHTHTPAPGAEPATGKEGQKMSAIPAAAESPKSSASSRSLASPDVAERTSSEYEVSISSSVKNSISGNDVALPHADANSASNYSSNSASASASASANQNPSLSSSSSQNPIITPGIHMNPNLSPIANRSPTANIYPTPTPNMNTNPSPSPKVFRAREAETRAWTEREQPRMLKGCPITMSSSVRRLLQAPLPRYTQLAPRPYLSPGNPGLGYSKAESQTYLNQTYNCSESSLENDAANTR